MGLNKYGLKLFFHLSLISLSGFGFYWSIFSEQLIITNFVFLGIFFILFIYNYRYLTKTNRDLGQFIESIDFLDNVPSGKITDLSQEKLHKAYTKVIDQLKESWIKKETDKQFFKFILENIGIGVLSYTKTGEIELYNKAAKEIFGIRNLVNISGLDILKEGVSKELTNLKPGKTALINFEGKIEKQKLLAHSTKIVIDGKSLFLITLQNIKTQLEESELEAWQKLIRVLTHEIMNSVTPIKSLTYSMHKSLLDEKQHDIGNIIKGLKAIENRSKGLLGFVDSYKNLTQIPKPTYERVNVNSLFESALVLFKDELQSKAIIVRTTVKPVDLTILADEKLVSQVIINLIKNSIYALENSKNKKLNLTGNIEDNGKIIITVSDTGKGIPDGILDKIFVPFFTTRDKGSGIGLSFARQVMVLHNGSINVQSNVDKYTKFCLSF
ncbi:MAG: hypothetical protein A2W99_03575 [Bacteroidetes bacterium GWF2_33_16]|nr:MAG: hypothetical protein A2X00_11495 [Bacteroidetes bacterium GWE2_32_14]OFY08265.1 MAG: hypothetical protein A2W99_03575 [Bacteroidetes bacterium GWF2_33_16]